ncbi:Hypothetical predicted protein [Mytilus galloprovincialis]|uniref:Ig-like domain-containing protein n=1 Tax=Mytilus galloprovincialis TaxID=29158 RepID=A0A8B6D1B2_MYTGA|nr:Hypothetical predicted protein [Mytilus galloprovincialis]
MEPLNQQVAVSKEKYFQVYGSKVEIKVDIPGKSKVKSVIWCRNGKTLDTSSSSKYAPVNVTQPSLIIHSINKADVGVYVCKVVFEAENENEEQETSSPNIEVELKEVAVTKEKYSQVYGSKVEIKVDILGKSKVKSVIWYRNGKMLDTSRSSKYAPVNVTQPSLIIHSINKADVGVYVCKIVFEAENENEEEQETSSPNIEVELKEVAVSKEKYSQVYGSKVEIKVEIPGKSKVKSVIWCRNGTTLDTSSSSKYTAVNVTQPSLIIHSINKADVGVYVCKVVFEAENENEEEQETSSPNIEVELKG